MKAYKGFHKNEKGELVCNGFVFKEGEIYEHEGKVMLCESGFHACEAPLNCFNYYRPHDSEYHEVNLDGVSCETSIDTKRVAKSVKVGAKLDIPMLVKAQFEYVSKKVEGSPNYVDAAYGTAAANGYGSSSAANGYGSSSAANGNRSSSAANGNGSSSAANGDGSSSAANGYGSSSAANGYGSSSAANGNASVALAWGRNTKAKASKGSYIVLSEFGDYDGEKYPLLCAKMVKIDGKRYNPDTWYSLKDGKVVEADEADEDD